jgi:hypothetical protein
MPDHVQRIELEGGFFPIAEAVGRELVKEVVAPIGGAGMDRPLGGQVEIRQAVRDLSFEVGRHGCVRSF